MPFTGKCVPELLEFESGMNIAELELVTKFGNTIFSTSQLNMKTLIIQRVNGSW